MQLYLKEDFILDGLKDYGFKHVKNEKKEVYQNQGIELDVETRLIRSTSKCDLSLIIKMYDNNLLETK